MTWNTSFYILQRSNQVNIAMTSLPSSGVIREIIMDMKDDLITIDALEKLGSLIPTDEEVHSIKEAQKLHPEIPLGAAEQFLLGQ